MSTRVQRLRERRRSESDARFQTMLVRLEADWRDQLQIKNPDTAHVGRVIQTLKNRTERSSL